MRYLLLLLLATPAWAKGPKSGNPVVTRASIAVDGGEYDDAIKRIGALRKDLRDGTLTLEPERHGKALWLLASAHRARALDADNSNPVSDLSEAVEATVACANLEGAPKSQADCLKVQQELSDRLYVRIIAISEHGLDAPLTTDELVAASDLRQALQTAEDGLLRPHLAETRYRANTGTAAEADAAATAGLNVAKAAPPTEPRIAVSLASLHAQIRAFRLGDVQGAVQVLGDWQEALTNTPDANVASLQSLAGTLAQGAERIQASRAAAEAQPTDVKAQLAYTELLTKMGQHRDAAAWWRNATETSPDQLDLWHRRGVYHTNRAAFMQKLGAPHEALRVPLQDASDAFAGCLKVDPTHAGCKGSKVKVDGYLSQFK